MTNMLEIKNLSYVVEENNNEKQILNDISLNFEKGKIYVITGPNGSGKSTLVKTIMGLNTPKSGKITFDGKDITDLSITQRANLGMSYAFQTPVTFKGLKVKDLLKIAVGENATLGQMGSYLLMVGLCAKDYLDRPLDDKLSGGELKRIELAMTLARKGKLNIFDEPEAGIDLWSFSNLTNIFSSLKDATNIIVSHQKKILEIADEVILLQSGRVKNVGTYEEILPLIERKGGNNG